MQTILFSHFNDRELYTLMYLSNEPRFQIFLFSAFSTFYKIIIFRNNYNLISPKKMVRKNKVINPYPANTESN